MEPPTLNTATERQSPSESETSGWLPRPGTEILVAGSVGAGLGVLFLYPAFWMCGWVILAPLFLLLRDRDAPGNFLIGWIAGLIWFGVSCHWLRHVTWVGLGSLALAEATWLGLWMMLAGLFSRRWRFYVLPMLWVCMEFLRSKGPLGFSWNLMGHLSGPLDFLAQGWGVYGLTFALVAGNSLLAWLTLVLLRRAPVEFIPEGAGFFLTLPVIWLGVALWEVSPNPVPERHLLLGLVQGNFPQSLKWSVPIKEAVERYSRLTGDLVQEKKPDLVVWPEVALPTILSGDPGLLEYLRGAAEDWNAALLFGVLDEDQRGDQPHLLYNSAVFLDPLDQESEVAANTPAEASYFLRGECSTYTRSLLLPSVHAAPQSAPIRVYDKARLLPFGEYVPLGNLFTFIQRFVENRGGGAFSGGALGRVLETRFGEIGPLICFESTHPGLARRAVLNGAHLLVNLTNDAWFLDTAAAPQHALQCHFRAIETGRAVARAANTGLSGVYLPDGNRIAALPPWKEAADAVEVPIYDHLTFQTRIGDAFAWLCLICLGFSLYLARRRTEGVELGG
ncbi:MAG: Apolipoprotein N-acyltransferase [bacterium]|nr:Apolipoprotein N-acyltransferase [bacterium]